MNIILFEQEEIATGQQLITIDDHRAKHIVKVIRAEVGDHLKVGIINGAMGEGEIVKLTTKYPFEVQLKINLDFAKVEQDAKIDIILALPRPIMLKRILSQATTLGIGRLYLINAKRVEKSFWQASVLQEDEYRTHLVQGLEQAVATRLPEIIMDKSFKRFSEKKLPDIRAQYQHKILADPSGDLKISDLFAEKSMEQDTSSTGRVLLAIGSEGGWQNHEIEAFKNNNFNICNMGDRILKVDTAVIALHSIINSYISNIPSQSSTL